MARDYILEIDETSATLTSIEKVLDLPKLEAEVVELEALRDVAVQRGGIELRQQVDPVEAGVQTVRDGDVHQPVLAGQRDRRLGTVARERKEPRALAAAHDDRERVVAVGGVA